MPPIVPEFDSCTTFFAKDQAARTDPIACRARRPPETVEGRYPNMGIEIIWKKYRIKVIIKGLKKNENRSYK